MLLIAQTQAVRPKGECKKELVQVQVLYIAEWNLQHDLAERS